MAANPLLISWTEAPPFDEVRLEHFAPAFDEAMALERREIDAIANEPSPPTFENTIIALENAGRVYDQVSSIYYVWTGTLGSPELQALEREIEPKIAAQSDAITQNAKLFARIESVYGNGQTDLDAEQRRLTWKKYTSFVRAGAKLGDAEKVQVAAMNQRLASLYTAFSQHLLAEEERALLLDHESDLDGLPEPVKQAAKTAAEARGHADKWAVENTRSAIEPFLTYATRADLRERVWTTYVKRGDNGDANDTKEIITEILSLRFERAKLLGYPSHAHWRLESSMARTPARALALMEKVWAPAVARVRADVVDLEAMAGRPISPWDYRFFAEKVRKAKYDIDETELTPYLQLEKLREGMFWVAGELFDFEFRPAKLPVYHPDVRTWTVHDRKSGITIGSWYFDPYARPGKKSGAWMNAYRPQSRGVRPVVSNNANFLRGREGEPVLVSFTDATTLFHEFGHAIHGLCSDVTYASLSGTRVARDYVEFPSQLLEHWLSTPEVLERFAVHHQTGAPLPKPLAAKLARAKTFNHGFGTVEYLSAAFVDMKLHLAEGTVDPTTFEKETLAALGMPAEIVMRHRTPQFAHIFSGDAYSAAYYSYLWADTLTADAFVAFIEGAGPFDRTVANRLRRHVLSVGDTQDPAEAYRAFRGRDVDTTALMKERGLA